MNKQKIINLLLFNPLTLALTAVIFGWILGYIVAIPLTLPIILFVHYVHTWSWWIKMNVINLSTDTIELFLVPIFLFFYLFYLFIFGPISDSILDFIFGTETREIEEKQEEEGETPIIE